MPPCDSESRPVTPPDSPHPVPSQDGSPPAGCSSSEMVQQNIM